MQKRLDSLDVIRGVALAGIAFANVPTLWQLSYSYADLPINLLNPLVTQRIFPVFSLLFGIGFGMMWDRATQRSTRPRLVMLRRILGLGLFAAAHFYFHPGEALAPYAVAALVFLMALTFVPDRRLTPVALTAGVWAWSERGLGAFAPSTPYAGIIMAATWVTLVLALMATPLRGLLTTAFAPLGRMVLTNYLAATAILLLLAPADKHNQLLLAFATVVAMLSVQWLFSLLWTRHVGQGPLEKLSRLITWGPVRHNGNHDRAVDLQRVP